MRRCVAPPSRSKRRYAREGKWHNRTDEAGRRTDLRRLRRALGVAFRIARQLGKGAQTLHNWSERAASRPKILAVGFGLFCTVVTWTPTVLAPLTGLDPSWNFGLAYSEVHHLAWGPGLDFTYGPLGFLTVRTLYFGSQAALAFAHRLRAQLALFTLLFRFTRTELPLGSRRWSVTSAVPRRSFSSILVT